MGLKDLLPELGPLVCMSNIYAVARGRRVDVDGHVWLHQLAYAHAQSIALDRVYQPLAINFLQQAHVALGRGLELLFVFDVPPR